MKRLQRIPTICPQCGKEFLLKPYLAKKPSKYGRFCSMSCKSKFCVNFNPASQRNRVIEYCAYCGKKLDIQPYRTKQEKVFCSRECSGKYGTGKRWAENPPPKVIVICDYCGKEKAVAPWGQRKERGQAHHFCDRKCFSLWKSYNWTGENSPTWRGGHINYYGQNWRRQARRARARDQHTCQLCGITEKELGRALDVHHKIRFGDFGEDYKKANLLTNLISYCHKCHLKTEYI